MRLAVAAGAEDLQVLGMHCNKQIAVEVCLPPDQRVISCGGRKPEQERQQGNQMFMSHKYFLRTNPLTKMTI